MDNQAATPNRTALDDLLYLVEGRGEKQIGNCLSLARKVCETLNIDTDGTSSQREAILQRLMSDVADHLRDQAHAIPRPVVEPANNTAFQAAAAAELLGRAGDDDADFLRLRDDYCRHVERTWNDLSNDSENRSAGRMRRLRAGVWIAKSGRTAYEQRTALLKAFEAAIATYLITADEKVREELRAIALSHPKPSSSPEARVSLRAQAVSPTSDSPHTIIDYASSQDQPTLDPQLRRATHNLAESVRHQWHEEQGRRKENDPFLLPIRWKNSPKQYAAHWATVRGVPENNEEIALDGTLDEVVKVFESVPSKRLVVLGQGGAGKTTLGIELLLKLLSSAHCSSGDSVPVIFNLASWDPVQQSLRDWITERIIGDYQDLSTTIKRHRTSSAQLVYADHVLPILDGFDEINPDLRTAAIQALNVYAGKMVMTSRVQEYYDAIDAGDVILSRAAVIVLEDLTLHEISHYLPLTTRPLPDGIPSRTKWDPVLNHMRSAPDDAHSATLLEVFATPLMVSLARRIYSDTPADPIELLDSDRFPIAATMSDYLFDQFIQVTYDQLPQDHSTKRYGAWRADEAQYRLACFAMYLHSLGVRDLSCFSSEMKKTRSIQAPFPWSVTKLSQRIYRQLVLSKIERDRLKKAYFPRPSKKFLEDAYRRGVLRRSGDNYEFRHVLLQHRLAYKALIGHKKIGKHEFVHDVTRHLAIELFRRGRFAEAENLLRVRLELLCNPPWRRGKLFKRRPAEWSIEYTDIMVIWNMSVVGGGSSGGWVLLPRSARRYL